MIYDAGTAQAHYGSLSSAVPWPCIRLHDIHQKISCLHDSQRSDFPPVAAPDCDISFRCEISNGIKRNIGSTTRLGMKLAYWLAGTSRTELGKQHVVNVLTRYEIKKLP